MSGPFWQYTAFVILIVGMFVGNRILAKRERTPSAARAERVVLLTMLGGFLGAPFWWSGDPDAFAWTLAPLAGRFLGAAGIAFGVACFMVLRKPDTRQYRLVGWMLAAYMAPLAVAIVLFHGNGLDMSKTASWGFVLIVTVLLIGSAWLLVTQKEMVADHPPSVFSEWVLTKIGTIAGLWGAALYVWPDGPASSVWLWAKDPLTSRLIASMFMTIAIATLIGHGHARSAEIVLATTVVYASGICLGVAASFIAGKPVPLGYMAFWLFAGIAAAIAYKRSERRGDSLTPAVQDG
jgi:hypothetical protein